MKYEMLSKLYYKDKELFESQYKQRKNGIYAVDLGINVFDNEAFYVNIPDFVKQISSIYKKYTILNQLCIAMPGVAYASYERKCLIDEIILTNDIEGVRSTRKEIINVLDDKSESASKKRFDGLVEKYLLLLDNPIVPYDIKLNNSRDIRKLYDEIVLDEVDESNWPDGEIFRSDVAEVVSAAQQVKHVGIHPESKIISCIDKTLALLKNEEIPELHKIAILHYMIGYIHPFYDGNGRLSRFISSYLLKKEFNTLVALRLAFTIKDNKKDYYKAFDITNDTHNKGDLTHFIYYFSDVIEKSIDSLIDRLNYGKATLDFYSEALDKKYGHFDAKDKKKNSDVLWYLIQNELFSNEAFDKKDLGRLLKTNPETAHRYVEALVRAGVPVEIKKDGKKFIYKLDMENLEGYLANE